MFFNRMGLAVFWGITAVILLLILIINTCKPVNLSTGGQPTLPALPTQPAQAPNLAAMPTIEVFSTLPPQIREQARQLQFTPISATQMVTGELDAHESDSFVLWAQAGQTLSMLTDGTTRLTLLDASGLLLAAASDTQAVWAILPTTGDYFVTAEASAENGRYQYTLIFGLNNTLTVPPAAQSQTAPQLENILIIKENTSTTVPGTLQNGIPNLYQIPAETGESLVVFINALPSDIQVILTGQDKKELGHTTTGIPLTRQLLTSQDYLLQVYLMAGSADVDYLLTIARIESGSPPTPAMQEALSFAPGTTSTYVNGTVDKNTDQTYTYEGTIGQRLMIDVVPDGSGITISVRGKDGAALGWTPAGIQFSATLPSTQTYFIDLVAPDRTLEPLDYVMTVTIQ